MPSAVAILTLVHVGISIAAIGAGLIVLIGLLTGKRLDRWTAFFLTTTVATSVTGFFFPVERFMPSHAIGIISLLVLLAAILARYRRRLSGNWRWIYVAKAMMALYLNVLVLVVQAFLKAPALHALAPTQSEPPFVATQLVVLTLFITLTVLAIRRFRTESP